MPPTTRWPTSSAVSHIQHSWLWWDLWAAPLQFAHFLAGPPTVCRSASSSDRFRLFPFFTFYPTRVPLLFSALGETTFIFTSPLLTLISFHLLIRRSSPSPLLNNNNRPSTRRNLLLQKSSHCQLRQQRLSELTAHTTGTNIFNRGSSLRFIRFELIARF